MPDPLDPSEPAQPRDGFTQLRDEMVQPRTTAHLVNRGRLPDAELAADYRARMAALLAPVCDLMNEAQAAGLAVSFSVMPTPPNGRHVVQPVVVARYY